MKGSWILVRGFSKRLAAVSATAVGALAFSLVGAGAADAAVASGSVTLTISDSFLSALAHHGVAVVPQNYSSISYDNTAQTVTVTFAANGGNADLTNDNGTVNLNGGLIAVSCHGKQVSLSSLQFDLGNTQFDGAPNATVGEVPLVDLAGSQTGQITGTTQTYSASSLVVDAAGASYLDSALGTTAFAAGQAVGSFSATWVTR
jgi:hypothetical protein